MGSYVGRTGREGMPLSSLQLSPRLPPQPEASRRPNRPPGSRPTGRCSFNRSRRTTPVHPTARNAQGQRLRHRDAGGSRVRRGRPGRRDHRRDIGRLAHAGLIRRGVYGAVMSEWQTDAHVAHYRGLAIPHKDEGEKVLLRPEWRVPSGGGALLVDRGRPGPHPTTGRRPRGDDGSQQEQQSPEPDP